MVNILILYQVTEKESNLKENLFNEVYEIFEKDPVKYVQYKKAIIQYLLDRCPKPIDNTNNTNNNDIPINIFVVGAGRGPLVTLIFKAFK